MEGLGMRNASAAEPLRADINVTPLVDVCLVLLIIFMVVTPVLRVGREVAVPPRAKGPVPVVPAGQLVVSLAADGALSINSEPVAPGSFSARLSQVLQGRAGQPTFVAAADAVPYQKVVRLMDLCREAGAANLAIVVDDLTSR